MMPDEPLVTPYDEPLPGAGGEIDPLPVYPVYPPPPPPPDFPPPPPPADASNGFTCYAAFGVELYEAASSEVVLQGLSAQYLETASLELPLTDAAQTEGEFAFAVQKDPNYPDDRHYTVFVAGAVVDSLVILAVNLPAQTSTSNSQVGGSLGKLSPLV